VNLVLHGSGRVRHLWFGSGFRKIPLKNAKFFNFFPCRSKKSDQIGSIGYPGQPLIYCGTRVCSVWVRPISSSLSAEIHSLVFFLVRYTFMVKCKNFVKYKFNNRINHLSKPCCGYLVISNIKTPSLSQQTFWYMECLNKFRGFLICCLNHSILNLFGWSKKQSRTNFDSPKAIDTLGLLVKLKKKEKDLHGKMHDFVNNIYT